MIFLLLLVAFDLLALAALLAAFQVVTQRQLRVYATVEHLAALARRNLPLHTGLRMVARDAGGFYGARLERAAQALEDGRPLADALEECASVLPAPICGMARAGERSGNLARFMEDLAQSYRALVDFHHRTVYVFIYPVVLSLVVFGVTQFMRFGLFPRFRQIARHFALTWPETPFTVALWATEITFTAAILLALAVYVGAGSTWFGRSFRWLQRAAMLIPFVRRTTMDAAMRQFALACGLMVRSGATLPDAVRTAAESETNAVLRARLQRVAQAVEEGGRLGDAVRRAALPAPLDWFADAGEASGLLAENLLQAAAWFETRLTYTSHIATKSVVPVFVVANGVALLAVWYGVFGPILGALARVVG